MRNNMRRDEDKEGMTESNSGDIIYPSFDIKGLLNPAAGSN